MDTRTIFSLFLILIAIAFNCSPSFSAGMGRDDDFAIIGSGSAAFSAATSLVSKGVKVTMIEDGTIGGTCVNVGCVPSKILIRAGQVAHTQEDHPFRGVEKHKPAVDSKLLQEQLARRVGELRSSKYEDVLRHNPNITFVKGRASFVDKNTLSIEVTDLETKSSATKTLKAGKVLIATGSTPYIPEIPGLRDTPYWTSTEALFSGKIPTHLIVIGGSYVAAELAQAFSHLGSKVTILTRSTLLSHEDPDIGHDLKGVFEGEGMKVLNNALPKSVSYREGFFHLDMDEKIAGEKDIRGDHLLIATGRHANTRMLGLDRIGVRTTPLGNIMVDDHMRTNVGTIFAAGDCTTQPQYVYVAAAAGSRAAINMLGGDASLDLSIVPAVVFTEPQVATVGLSVAQARILGIDADARKLSLEAVPRALANFDTRGFIKLVMDKKTQRIIGSQILAAEAGDVIQTAALAIRNNMTVRDLTNQLFPYLTMVEGLKLCGQTFYTDVKKLSCCSDIADEGDKKLEAVKTAARADDAEPAEDEASCCEDSACASGSAAKAKGKGEALLAHSSL